MTEEETKLLRHVLGMHETTRVPVRNGTSAKFVERYYADLMPSIIEHGLMERNPGGGAKEYTATKMAIRRTLDQPWK